VGGSGAASNPQFQIAHDGVAPDNTTPSLITANGPTRKAQFQFFFNSKGSIDTSAPNGGVEDLSTVTGRSDARDRSLSQPNFAPAEEANNIIFRIPTPTFGAGFIENLDDSRFNLVPVRIIIDKDGKVKQIHLLSAFTDQAKVISEALDKWKFKPYRRDGQPVEVETGILFGRAQGSQNR